jgi:multidrug efflux pump subunit AcrB
VRVSGQFERIEDIRETIVGSKNAKPIYLKNVAEVRRALKEPAYIARFKGTCSIFLTVTQKEGTNVLRLGEQANAVLARMREALPKDLSAEVVFHQPDQVAERLSTFQSNLLIGMLLVGFLVFLFMGLRMSLIVMTAIPLSMLIAFGCMHSAGVALEQISIAALIIALGMLVDNAIVVTENIHRLIEAGKSRREATSEGATEVGWAVTAATATTIAAFIPLMLMTGDTGAFIRSIPYTVSFALLASLLVAMTVTPLLCYRLLKPTDKEGRLVAAIRMFIDRFYSRFLGTVLRRRGMVLCAVFVAFVGTMSLASHIGVEFFPKAERPQFLIDVVMPEGTSFDATDGMTRSIEDVLIREPSVLNFAANVGKGNPRIYYNVFRRSEATNYAQILVNLKTGASSLSAAEMIGKLRREFRDVTDGRIEMREFEQGPPIGAPVAIRISGDEVGVLRGLAGEVADRLSGIEGAVNVDNNLKTAGMDVEVHINRDKARILGLPNHTIARTVRAAISGETATTFREKGQELDVVVRFPKRGGKGYADLDRIYLPSLSGAQIPLSQVAQVRFMEGTSRILHRDRTRTATVRADLEGRLADEVVSDLKKALGDLPLPEGYAIEFGGETEERDKPFRSLLRAMLIAIIAIYGILVLQFNSFSQPLVILVAVPLAFIGAIGALFITGNPFGFMAFVGAVSLSGVVVNDAIVLIDFTNHLRKRGASIREAVIQAGRTRFVPVILTTVTTIGGLLPLTLRGGTLWAPMGWTIIGGLAFATVLTLLIVPVLYSLIARE